MMKMWKMCVGVLMVASVACGSILSVGTGQTYSTITDAFSNVAAGDTIEIHEGTYTEFPNLSGSGTGLNNVTFQRYGDDKVVIDLSSYIYLRYRTGNQFNGLIFDATDTGGHAVYLRSSAHYTKFNNCVFYNAASAGVYAYGGSGWITGIVVDNCTFYNSGTGYYTSNAITGSTVTDNLFVNNGTGANSASSTYPFTVDTSGFWNNTANVAGYASLGTGNVTTVEPIFASTNINDADFMYLDNTTPSAITTGDSDGGVMGARGVVPEPATMALLLTGSLAVLRRRRA